MNRDPNDWGIEDTDFRQAEDGSWIQRIWPEPKDDGGDDTQAAPQPPKSSGSPIEEGE